MRFTESPKSLNLNLITKLSIYKGTDECYIGKKGHKGKIEDESPEDTGWGHPDDFTRLLSDPR